MYITWHPSNKNFGFQKLECTYIRCSNTVSCDLHYPSIPHMKCLGVKELVYLFQKSVQLPSPTWKFWMHLIVLFLLWICEPNKNSKQIYFIRNNKKFNVFNISFELYSFITFINWLYKKLNLKCLFVFFSFLRRLNEE